MSSLGLPVRAVGGYVRSSCGWKPRLQPARTVRDQCNSAHVSGPERRACACTTPCKGCAACQQGALQTRSVCALSTRRAVQVDWT